MLGLAVKVSTFDDIV